MDGRLSWPRHAVVCKQSTQYCYMMDIAVVSCSNCYASLGNWSAGGNGQTHNLLGHESQC